MQRIFDCPTKKINKFLFKRFSFTLTNSDSFLLIPRPTNNNIFGYPFSLKRPVECKQYNCKSSSSPVMVCDQIINRAVASMRANRSPDI